MITYIFTLDLSDGTIKSVIIFADSVAKAVERLLSFEQCSEYDILSILIRQ